MKKEQLERLQERFLTDIDEKYFGEVVRLTVTPSDAYGYVEVFERIYNPLRKTFSKPRRVGITTGGSTMIVHSEVGSIITEKHWSQSFPTYRMYAVSIMDDDNYFENPKAKRAWDDEFSVWHEAKWKYQEWKRYASAT